MYTRCTDPFRTKRAAAQKKNANLNAAAVTAPTPAAEPVPEPEAPTPATPMTPASTQQNVNRPGQTAGPTPAMPNGQPPAPVPPQAAPPMVPQPDQTQNTGFNMDGMVSFRALSYQPSRNLLTRSVLQEFSMDFANPLATDNVLNDFDFDSFLHDNEGDAGAFDFSSAAGFSMDPEIET